MGTPDATTNAQRARNLALELEDIDDHEVSADGVDAIELALNLAEDRGARQPIPADADTVQALRDTIAEVLGDRQGEYAATSKAIAEAICDGFDVRLKDEPEPTDPLRGPGQ